MSSSGSPPPTAAAKPFARVGSEALEKLKRGEWTVEQYIEDRVERALAGLAVPLTAEQRESVRETLRTQITTDPVVREYARLTTRAAAGAAR
jgi:hypothetical protein